MLLGVYNYTVVLTYIGMLFSYGGLMLAFQGNIHGALCCLMMSGVCDMFDGKIASTKTDRTHRERRFGVQIDSLSDLICFGVLPAVTVSAASGMRLPYICIGGLYVLCALMRLAWFNVDEEERQNTSTGSRTVYLGLPVTSSALLLPALMGAALRFGWNAPLIGGLTLLCMGTAFLLPFRLKKPTLPAMLAMLCAGCAELCILFVGIGR